MTDGQKRFCEEYLIDCNATRAYKAAYPKIKNNDTAKSLGSRMLANANVRAYIDAQLEQMRSEKIADATEIMEYLTSVLRGETQSEIVVVEGVTKGVTLAKKIKKAPDEKERLKAAELLGKRYGLYKENVEMEVESITIKNDLLE